MGDYPQGTTRSPEHRAAISSSLSGRTKSEEHRRNISAGRAGMKFSDEHRANIGKANTRRWSDPEYVKRLHIGPNKAERRLLELISPLGFKFSGDGTLLVGSKRPDFWDGRTKLIELYGDYWHRGQDPQDRIDLFKTEGYDCLVIWEHELEDIDSVLDKVNKFGELQPQK